MNNDLHYLAAGTNNVDLLPLTDSRIYDDEKMYKYLQVYANKYIGYVDYNILGANITYRYYEDSNIYYCVIMCNGQVLTLRTVHEVEVKTILGENENE